MKPLRTYLTYTAAVFLLTLSAAHGAPLDVDGFIAKACIRYETSFAIEAPLELWNHILDNPLLMGKLWEVYDFSPRYRFTGKGSGVHVIDPTGIEGDLVEIHRDVFSRIFYGSGTMNNWFIPVSLRGKALFMVQQAVDNEKVVVTLKIYGEGGDTIITRLLLKALSPILTIHINHRVTHNISDFTTIVDDIVRNPEKIRPKISGRLLFEFERLIQTSG